MSTLPLGPHAKIWMTSACAVLTAVTRRAPRHDLLGGTPKSPETTRITQTILANSWDIVDARGLRATLAWLRDEGHRASLPGSAAGDLGPLGLLAWDYVRLIAVAGWGYVADYISEEEAWAFIAPAATKLAGSYRSWEELGRAYVKGTFAWSAEEGPPCQAALEALLTDASSPWRTIPWSMPMETPAQAPALARAKPRTSLAVYAVVMMTAAAGLGLVWLTVGRSVAHAFDGAHAAPAAPHEKTK